MCLCTSRERLYRSVNAMARVKIRYLNDASGRVFQLPYISMYLNDASGRVFRCVAQVVQEVTTARARVSDRRTVVHGAKTA